MDYRGQDLFAREAKHGHVLPHFRAYGWKSLGECHHMLVFGAFPHFSKARVVAVLLSSPSVPAGSLDVPVCEGANPHVGPGRRYGERLDAPNDLGFGHLRTIGATIPEAFPRFPATYAGAAVGDIPQAGRLRCVLGVDDRMHI